MPTNAEEHKKLRAYHPRVETVRCVCAAITVAWLGTHSVALAEGTESTEPGKSTVPFGAALGASTNTLAPAAATATPSGESAMPALPPNATECGTALSKSQLFGAGDQLIEAREQARICSNPACPPPIIAECVRSAGELDQAIPAVTFQVRLASKPVSDAQVYADGRLVPDWIKGKALQLNPGEHVFHFDLAGHSPISQIVKLKEGIRYTAVEADFISMSDGLPAPVLAAAPTPAPVVVHYERPVPWIVYPLLGVGGLGVLAFTSLGVIGQLEQHNLEQSCAPRCTDADKSSMRRLYLAADISLGIGTATLIGAGILYLGRPETASAPIVGMRLVNGGAAATLTLQQL